MIYKVDGVEVTREVYEQVLQQRNEFAESQKESLTAELTEIERIEALEEAVSMLLSGNAE